MTSVVAVNPFRCRVWELHDRLEGEINEHTCRREIRSFETVGQLVPALGRPVRGDPCYEVELIYGARRLFVARHINRPLLVELRELSDREAIVVMEVENAHRKDLSAYERGMSYLRWLRSGLFQSQDEIARALKVSASQVSRLIKVARLPTVVVQAFPSALGISETWGLGLTEALDDPVKRPLIIRKARHIAAMEMRPSAHEVYRLLASSASGRRSRPARDVVVRGLRGTVLFRIRQRRSCVTLTLPLRPLSEAKLDSIQKAITRIVQDDADAANERPAVK